MPQYLKQNDYYTYSIGKIFHPGVSSNYSDDYPLSWSEPTFHPITEKYINAPVCPDSQTGKLYENLICPITLDNQPEMILPDIESMLKAKEKLREFQNMVNPFFLAVGFHKPHIPFKFPAKYLKYHAIEKFTEPDFSQRPSGQPIVSWNPYNDIRLRHDVSNSNISFPYGPVPKDFGMKMRQAYYASVTYIDDLIGEILKDIDETNTLIILTSDHGWSLGEHSEWAKYSNYDVALKVPLIFKSPNYLGETKFITNPVELIDLLPTLIDLIKLPQIPNCFPAGTLDLDTCTDGKSLSKYFSNDTQFNLNINDSIAFSQYPRPSMYPSESPNSDRPKLHQIRIMGYSLRTNQYRYTLWVKFSPKKFTKYWNKIVGEEFYDHSIDPDENINLNTRSELDGIRLDLRKILIDKFD